MKCHNVMLHKLLNRKILKLQTQLDFSSGRKNDVVYKEVKLLSKTWLFRGT